MTTPFYSDNPPVIAILGPTATGKTAAAVELALEFDGEVVSLDSRYLYRGLDIGTAKPSLPERRGVPHHLIDILNPTDDYSLALFQDDAYRAISDVHGRDCLPILAGGAPLYARAVLEGWKIPKAPPDPQFRAEMESIASRDGLDSLHQTLERVDPIAAARIPPRNVRRVIRALEIHHQTGVAMSALEGREPPPYRILKFGLEIEREALYQRIDQRVMKMIEAGLIDEVRALLDEGVAPDRTAMRSIGYQEVIPYLRGEYDETTMIERIKANTHRYVRHQMTWLRKTPGIVWIDALIPDLQGQLSQLVNDFIRK